MTEQLVDAEGNLIFPENKWFLFLAKNWEGIGIGFAIVIVVIYALYRMLT